VLESGNHVGHAMREWGHVQLFALGIQHRQGRGAAIGSYRVEFSRTGSVPDRCGDG
jgi:hypothetical protein